MRNSKTRPLRTLVHLAFLAAAALIPATAIAQNSIARSQDLRLPISLDADTTAYDGKSSMLMFTGLKLAQGSIGVEADEGRASNLDFEDSVWEFTGSVVIDVENGHIECDSAHLKFSGHELQHATIIGSPATFEMQRQGSDVVTYAEAGRLDYDFAEGIVKFSDDATITEGGNEISSDYLVYNIQEQRINARSAGEGERVKIRYTPTDSGDREDGEASPPSDGEQIEPEPENGDQGNGGEGNEDEENGDNNQ